MAMQVQQWPMLSYLELLTLRRQLLTSIQRDELNRLGEVLFCIVDYFTQYVFTHRCIGLIPYCSTVCTKTRFSMLMPYKGIEKHDMNHHSTTRTL